MKSLLIWLVSFPLFAAQDCTIRILIDPLQEDISASQISYGDEISSDDGAVLNIASVGVNLSLTVLLRNVWRCDFRRSVNRQNLTVNYTLVSLNGQANRVSLGASSMPTSVMTNNLRFQRRNRTVTGDVAFQFDLSDPQMKQAGSYRGVLTINVYEN